MEEKWTDDTQAYDGVLWLRLAFTQVRVNLNNESIMLPT